MNFKLPNLSMHLTKGIHEKHKSIIAFPLSVFLFENLEVKLLSSSPIRAWSLLVVELFSTILS
jgi:hypothetical protein